MLSTDSLLSRAGSVARVSAPVAKCLRGNRRWRVGCGVARKLLRTADPCHRSPHLPIGQHGLGASGSESDDGPSIRLQSNDSRRR